MPQHNERQKSINFVLPPDQHRRLKALAVQHDTTLSELARMAIADYVRRMYLVDIETDDLSVGAWGGDRTSDRTTG